MTVFWNFKARAHPDIIGRLSTTEQRKQQLEDYSRLRKQRLIDALSLYKLLSDADSVEAWIDEKVCRIRMCAGDMWRRGAVNEPTDFRSNLERNF